jgi:hypothetical protein
MTNLWCKDAPNKSLGILVFALAASHRVFLTRSTSQEIGKAMIRILMLFTEFLSIVASGRKGMGGTVGLPKCHPPLLWQRAIGQCPRRRFRPHLFAA